MSWWLSVEKSFVMGAGFGLQVSHYDELERSVRQGHNYYISFALQMAEVKLALSQVGKVFQHLNQPMPIGGWTRAVIFLSPMVAAIGCNYYDKSTWVGQAAYLIHDNIGQISYVASCVSSVAMLYFAPLLGIFTVASLTYGTLCKFRKIPHQWRAYIDPSTRALSISSALLFGDVLIKLMAIIEVAAILFTKAMAKKQNQLSTLGNSLFDSQLEDYMKDLKEKYDEIHRRDIPPTPLTNDRVKNILNSNDPLSMVEINYSHLNPTEQAKTPDIDYVTTIMELFDKFIKAPVENENSEEILTKITKIHEDIPQTLNQLKNSFTNYHEQKEKTTSGIVKYAKSFFAGQNTFSKDPLKEAQHLLDYFLTSLLNSSEIPPITRESINSKMSKILNIITDINVDLKTREAILIRLAVEAGQDFKAGDFEALDISLKNIAETVNTMRNNDFELEKICINIKNLFNNLIVKKIETEKRKIFDERRKLQPTFVVLEGRLNDDARYTKRDKHLSLFGKIKGIFIKAVPDKKSEEMIAYSRKRLEELLEVIKNRNIKEGDVLDYEFLERNLKHIAKLLKDLDKDSITTSEKISIQDNLMKLAMEAGGYCAAGKIEAIEDTYKIIAGSFGETNTKEKILLILENQRRSIFQTILQAMFNMHPACKKIIGLVGENDVHTYNQMSYFFNDSLGLNSSSGKNDLSARPDAITEGIYGPILTLAYSRLFFEGGNLPTMQINKELLEKEYSEIERKDPLPFKDFITKVYSFLKNPVKSAAPVK